VGVIVGAGVNVSAGCVRLTDAVAPGVAVAWTTEVGDTVCVSDAVGAEVVEATRAGMIITSVAGAPPAMAAFAMISPVN
jgi:hypothetical protein